MATQAPGWVRDFRFAGISSKSWVYAVRVWVAEICALYVAFWLQVETPANAAVTVAILSLQTRGQVLQKAAFRLGGTLVGILASIVIAGLFSQTRDLYLLAYAGWLGVCVFAAGFLDGNRAYGAVLAGYTVANVTVRQIDAPQNVFLGGLNQAAAIVIGVAVLTLVDDLFAGPNIHPAVLARLSAAADKTRGLARSALAGGTDAVAIAHLLTEITALHPDITAVGSEWPGGRMRGRSARRAAWSLTGALEAVRALDAATDGKGVVDDATRAAIEAALSNRRIAAPLSGRGGSADEPARSLDDFLVARCVGDLLERNDAVSDALDALRTGRRTTRSPGLPLYRSRRQAVQVGLRAFLAILIATVPLVLSSWPGTSATLSLLGVALGLSSANLDPVGFAAALLKAMPLAIAAAGVTEFLILDGVSEFPLLALAMAPTIFAACFCLASGKPQLFGFGLLLLVFFTVLLQPSNPQSYDPQSFLFSAILSMVAVAALYVVLTTMLPITYASKRRWFRSSAKDELQRSLNGPCGGRSEAARTYKAADRIGQLAALPDGTPAQRDADLRHALYFSDLSAAFRRARAAVAALPMRDDARVAGMAALDARDADAIYRIGEYFLRLGPSRLDAAAAFAWVAKLSARPCPDVVGGAR